MTMEDEPVHPRNHPLLRVDVVALASVRMVQTSEEISKVAYGYF